MPFKPSVIYWDTCVFLSVLQKNERRLPDLVKIISEAENNRLVIVTSALTIAETSFIDGRESTTDVVKQAETIRQFFEMDYFDIRPVDRTIGASAADIVRKHKGVTPSDAIQIATAFAAKCQCLYTYDGDNITGRRRRGKLLPLDGKIVLPKKLPLSIKTPDKFFSSSPHPLLDQLPD